MQSFPVVQGQNGTLRADPFPAGSVIDPGSQTWAKANPADPYTLTPQGDTRFAVFGIAVDATPASYQVNTAATANGNPIQGSCLLAVQPPPATGFTFSVV